MEKSYSKRIALIGYMGAGKSHIGRQLAAELELPFFDLDEVIGQLSGCSLTDLMRRKGEIVFREFEQKALQMVLKKDAYVLACGGGTPAYYNNMDELLDNAHVVYLDCSINVLESRLLPEKATRPLLESIPADEVGTFIAKHLFERRPYYERAHQTIKGDQLVVEELVSALPIQD
jgi:shikimate kinase